MKQIHIQHLHWRAGFGIDIDLLAKIKKHSKTSIISKLFIASEDNIPLDLDLTEFLPLKNMSQKALKKEINAAELQRLRQKSQQKVRDLNVAWLDRLTNSNAVLLEKMTLFWANIFVCRDTQIFHTQQYNNTLRKYALGNFRDFVKAIAREASMSKYLNNKQNNKGQPNENFARELMEIFTLGIGNYTEVDIKEAARAFTGWNYKLDGTYFLKKSQHDYQEKTFLGKTGNFDGDQIIDIIIAQKQCARFICMKIYGYFVNPKIDENRVTEITELFYKDYDIKNLMQYIFSSSWFYQEENIGAKIKSPIELLVGICKLVPVKFIKERQLIYLQRMMGQVLLYPTNVAGWKGDKNWIDANTLMFRMKLGALILNDAVINLEEKGTFEDSFEDYYKGVKKRSKRLKTIKNWTFFTEKHQYLTSRELRNLLIASPIDKDTEELLDALKVTSNKGYCIQLMSIPEYQLC
jgi:uncharacterized protein (DUF1800 family)